MIIILADDMGWGDAGFNGCADIPTPHLDRLAESGTVFKAGYASHSYCSPSRAGLVTGRYQQRFGHENNTPYGHDDPDAGLPLNEKTIANVLRENGYRTYAIGKWHLGDDEKFWPNQRGFDYWFGFYGGGMSYWGDTGNKPVKSGVLRNGEIVPHSELSYLTDDFTEETVQIIEKKSDEPFFVYLAYNAPHGPIHATSEYLKLTDHIENGQRSAYGALVAGMDVGIGRIVDALEKSGKLDNTLIFFYSDNGGHLNGASNVPFRGYKGNLFEGGIRVPFVVSWGSKLKRENQFEHPITALDIFPTVLAAANIEIRDSFKLDGRNLLPYLKNGGSIAPHQTLYWRYSDGLGYAVRHGKYKLVESGQRNRKFLFDLENDPYEQHNLLNTHPDLVEELTELYEGWNAQLSKAKWYDPHPENLRKTEKARLSYIQKASAGERKKAVATK